MTNVLLVGYLDSKRLRETEKVLRSLVGKKGQVSLSVNSGGGNVAPTIRFIEAVGNLENSGLEITTMIESAKSMAAILALSVGHKRSMRADATIAFHRGTLQLEATDFDPKTGVIIPEVLSEYKKYERMLDAFLRLFHLSKNEAMMAELYGSNWLELDTIACLKFGLVNETYG